jgi:hypothetical protein
MAALESIGVEEVLRIVESIHRVAVHAFGVRGRMLPYDDDAHEPHDVCVTKSSRHLRSILRFDMNNDGNGDTNSNSSNSLLLDVICVFLSGSMDGGWLTALMFTSIMKHILQGDCSIRGFEVAWKLVENYFESNDSKEDVMVRFDVGNADMLRLVVRSVIAPSSICWMTRKDRCIVEDIVLRVISRSSSSAIPPAEERNSIRLPHIFYVQLPGLSANTCGTREDELLLDIPIPFALIQLDYHLSNVPIAVFDCSLEFPEVSDENLNFTAVEVDATQATSFRDQERNSLLWFLKSLLNNNVRIVACQKRIHSYLIRICQRFGIVCIPRVSAKYIGALLRITGARQLGSYASLVDDSSGADSNRSMASSLGFVSDVKSIILYGKKYVSIACAIDTSTVSDLAQLTFAYCSQCWIVSNNGAAASVGGYRAYCDEGEIVDVACLFADNALFRRQRMQTIVLSAPTQNLCEELQSVFEKCFRVFNQLWVDPRLLRGGGVWQHRIGEFIIRCYANELSRRGQRIPSQISLDEGWNYNKDGHIAAICEKMPELQSLKRKELDGLIYFGKSLLKIHSLADTGDREGCFDCFIICKQALEKAVESAVNISAIDGVISAAGSLVANYA